MVARQKDWALKQLQQRLTNIKRLEARQEALVDQLLETTQERDALESTVENLLQPAAVRTSITEPPACST